MATDDATSSGYMPATRLIELYEWKTLSPVEVVKEALQRIAAVDGEVNAFCRINEESALKAAKESEDRWMKGEPRGLADGVPLSVKDIIPVKGDVTRRGSKLTPESPPERFDAPAVARMREHGAVSSAARQRRSTVGKVSPTAR
jgi:aspartyl-tRNA(Asn)/glutamyl-tRNA(Gln) amidotransferase subunit A